MQAIKRFLGFNSPSLDLSNDLGPTEGTLNTLRCCSIGRPISRQKLKQDIFPLAKQGWFHKIEKNDLLALVDDVDDDSFTLLHYAIKNNHYSIAIDLIDAGNKIYFTLSL